MSPNPSESSEEISIASSPQTLVSKQLADALAMRSLGEEQSREALAILEEAMRVARAAPYEIEFQTRVSLALALGDLYVSGNELDAARRVLSEEAEFAEMIFQIMQATGTQEQKRAAAGGRIQIRDRARQVMLIGQTAPEIAIKQWVVGEPTQLSDLRGRVILLEFWATWCKPCNEMFPKLKLLDEKHRERGLEVIALTRHYFAGRDTASSEAEELELMRSVVIRHELEFRVGVSQDDSTQNAYGATGLPTLALIDRTGVVRYAHFGGGNDPSFNAILERSLNATFS